MNILFNQIRVVSPTQNIDETVNLWIKNGIILNCDNSNPIVDTETEIVDAKEFIAAPGFFDMHVHLRDPGFEYKEDIKTGSDSAANGGYTGIVCMPNTFPVIDNAAVVDYIRNKSKDYLVDVYPSAALTQKSEGKLLTEMFELNDCGVVMFTDDGHCVHNSKILNRAFEYASTRDLLIAEHCEDKNLTEEFTVNESKLSTKLGLKGYPNVAESSILYRDIEIAKHVGNCRYHAMHLSTMESIELIRLAKANNQRVTCEVTPHHFTINDSIIVKFDTNTKMNPPLRSQQDIDVIIEGIKDGTIDCIATDHAPHALHEKEVEFEYAPNGVIGLETSIGISLTELHWKHKVDLKRIIELMSVNPRRICKLPNIIIKKDEKANLTIFAPNEEWTVNKELFKSKSKNTPFNNYKLKGKPKYSINNNRLYKTTL
mgnify:CR=1 FL=1